MLSFVTLGHRLELRSPPHLVKALELDLGVVGADHQGILILNSDVSKLVSLYFLLTRLAPQTR